MKEKFKIHDTVFTPPSRCVRCRAKLNATTGIEVQKPSEGDISICFYCGQIMLFTADLKLRGAEPEELAEIMLDLQTDRPDVYKMLQITSRYFEIQKAAREN